MFSLTLAFSVLFLVGIQANSHENTLRTNLQDSALSLAKLRIADDGKTEELIPAGESEVLSKVLITTLPSNVQPLPSPCTGARPFTKLPHPEDKNKYIQCRDEFHYEIFACLNDGEYNDATKSCLATIDFVDPCRDESPCLNGAQCISHKNGTFRCACVTDWTGERCETPLHICATKPCGINAECRPIVAVDYKQDYICICKGRKEYGPNCLETVPNPCLADSEQFYPFAFSQRLYIQCDGESLFFQPCAQSLYWNQEDKLCDRRRPGTMSRKGSMKKIVIKPELSLDEKEKQTEKKFNLIDEKTTFPTPVVKEEARPEQLRNQMLPESSNSLSNNRIRNNQMPGRDSFLPMDNQPVMNDRQRVVPSQPIKTVFVPTEPVSGRAKSWQTSGSRPVSETLEFNNRPTVPTQQWQQTPPKRVEPTEDSSSFNVPVGKVTEEQLLRPAQQPSAMSMVDQPRTQMTLPSQRWSNKPITQNDQRFSASQMNQPISQNSGRGQMETIEMRDDAEMESRPETFQTVNNRKQEQPPMRNWQTANVQNIPPVDSRNFNTQRVTEEANMWQNMQVETTTLPETTTPPTRNLFGSETFNQRPRFSQQRGSMRMNFNQQERLTPEILPSRMEEQSTTTTTTPQPILTQPTNFQWQNPISVQQPRTQMTLPSQRWSNKPITQNDQRFSASQMNQPISQNSGRGQMGTMEMRDDAEMESRPEVFQSPNKRPDELMQISGQVNVQQTQKPTEERPDRTNQAMPFSATSWTQQSTFNQPQQQRDIPAFANAQVPSNDQFMMNSMETTTIANTPSPSNQGSLPSPLTSWKPMRLNDQRLSGNTFSGQKPTEPTRVSDTTQKQIVASWRF